MIRDTSTYKPFRDAFGGKTPSLKRLTAKMLGVSVQEGEHSSVQDAQAAVRLYTMFRKDWEKTLSEKVKPKLKPVKKKKRLQMNLEQNNLGKDKKKFELSSSSGMAPKYVDSDSD